MNIITLRKPFFSSLALLLQVFMPSLAAEPISMQHQLAQSYEINLMRVAQSDPVVPETGPQPEAKTEPADEPATTPAMTPAAASSEEETGTRKFWERWGFSGSARGGYWSSSRALDDEKNLGAGALWLKWTHKLPQGVGLYAEGWARSDTIIKGTDKKYLVREAYLDYALGDWDFRLGRQIIAWGRADRINPTDNLTPHNFKLLVPEDDDNRFGALAARVRYSFGDYSVTGIWLPDFRANVLPFPKLADVSYVEDTPGSQRSFATKFERSGKDLDWSLSYYDGFDLNPDISIASTGPGGVKLLLSHHRYQVLGADMATALGRYGLRAELAYARTQDRAGDDPFVKNPFFWGVIGGERTFLSYLNVNVQYFVRYVTKYEDPNAVSNPLLQPVALTQAIISNQRDRTQHGVTFRISNKWLNETIEVELAGMWDWTRHGYFLRPKAIYAINDKWKATAGADYYAGPDDSFFGRLKANKGVFAELSYGF